MNSSHKQNLISDLRMLGYQALIEQLIKGIDSGNMSAETLERAREVTMEITYTEIHQNEKIWVKHETQMEARP